MIEFPYPPPELNPNEKILEHDWSNAESVTIHATLTFEETQKLKITNNVPPGMIIEYETK